MKKRLTKGTDKIISGVCSGLANYFEIDVTLVRLIVIVATLFSMGFPIIIAYILGIIIMPEHEKLKKIN